MRNSKIILSFLIFFSALFLGYFAARSTSEDELNSAEDKLKIEVEVNTEKELLHLKEIGLNCAEVGKCICLADVTQLQSLRRFNYVFRPYSKVLATKRNREISQTQVFQMKIEVKSEVEQNLIKSLGLDCIKIGECTTEVDIVQMNQLKKYRIPFSGIREGIRVEGSSTTHKTLGSTYGESGIINYPIPLLEWGCSSITIDNAPTEASVTQLQVKYTVYDPDGEVTYLWVEFANQSGNKKYTLWDLEGSGQYIQETEIIEDAFDGESVNQTWKLCAMDYFSPTNAEIVYWKLTIWFSGPPVYMTRSTDFPIPYWPDSVQSTITVNTAPDWKRVSSMDIHYDVIHPYIGDLEIWLTDSDHTYEYWLWLWDGMDDNDIHQTVTSINTFNGEYVNQTWRLWARDWFEEDSGYIDFWSITLWYEDLPDLVIERMTPSNYNPMIGEYISMDMVIKNNGSRDASPFNVGFYKNLYWPPDIYTYEDDKEYIDTLVSGDSQLVTFTGITFTDTSTRNMYGLADCDGHILESDEDNNYAGPIRVKWWNTDPSPDLIIEEVWVSGYCPYLTDSVFVNAVIKNQGGTPTTCNWFYTDIFYNRTTAPDTTMDGDDSRPTVGQLAPGETDVVTFILPNPTSADTWTMWLLTDSDDLVDEGNESNNVYGSIELEWWELPTYKAISITRDQIIENAMGFTLIEWVCPTINATPPDTCEQWSSNYTVGDTFWGEAYEWGGSDDTGQFRCNLDKGLRAGALGVGGVCPLPPGGYAWATGVECCGLVWHSLESGYHTTKNLDEIGNWIFGWVEYLLKGDYLLTYDKHTFIFESWGKNNLMNVIEAGDFRRIDPDGSSEARYWDRSDTFYTQYNAYQYKNVQEVSGYNPDRAGDANSDGQVNVSDQTFLFNYIFKGSNIRPHPMWRGDANGDCKVSISDIVYLISYLFKGGDPPKYCTDCEGRTCYYYP
ncbi:MAG: dockerin type I domain-containing protein [candidate division Zixibacteria bacterium]|nr:dockerin type I domain-containing protein [candidate division Zixibacteria bacterium]